MPDSFRSALAERLQGLDIRQPVRPVDRPASVVMPILMRDEPTLVGISRGVHGLHGGQFALPGGRPEPEDAGSWATAQREAAEEIGLVEGMEHLGVLGSYITRGTRFRVEVHLAFVEEPPPWRPDGVEIAGVLEIPISVFDRHRPPLPATVPAWDLDIRLGFDFDAEPFLVAGELAPRGAGHQLERDGQVWEMPYVWGLTARALFDFLRFVWDPIRSSPDA